MISFWQTAAVAALGLATLASAVASLAMAWRSRSAWEGLARGVEDLGRRLRAIEAMGSPSGGRGLVGETPVRGVPHRGNADVTPATPTSLSPGPGSRASHRVDSPLIAVPSLAAAGSEAVAHEAAAILTRRYGPIWDLADSGQAVEAIAGATGQPVGQVELILALRRQAGPALADGRAVRHG